VTSSAAQDAAIANPAKKIEQNNFNGRWFLKDAIIDPQV